MGVPSGFGASLLDFTLCYRGFFAVIETKRTGKKLTPRQDLAIRLIKVAGGVVIAADSSDTCIQQLDKWMQDVQAMHNNRNA